MRISDWSSDVCSSDLHVDAYGSMMPLNQVASISVPEPRMISVQVWDRSMSKAVERAIRDSGLGLNPQSDGQLIRVPLPDLSQERRAELVKVASKYARSEEHTSELQSLMRISYAVFCLKKKKKANENQIVCN